VIAKSQSINHQIIRLLDEVTQRNTRNLKLDRSGQASNKSEKSKNGDEKKLETIRVKSKRKLLDLNFLDGGFIGVRFGGSGQESRDSGSLLALKLGKTILVNEFGLLLHKAGLGGFLVVERRRGVCVNSGVDKDGLDLFVASSRNLSKFEILGASSERRVSLALWWWLLQDQKNNDNVR
jgi:hypothetical protein